MKTGYNIRSIQISGIVLLGLLLGVWQTSTAQTNTAPQAMNYQAIVRDAMGNPLTNTQVCVRYTIDDSINPGIPVYRETQTVITNQYGLFTAQIGHGYPDAGDTFSNINWKTGTKYMQVEMEVNCSNSIDANYVEMGTEQLLSQPYVLQANYAYKTGNVNGDSTAAAKFATTQSVGSSLIYDAGANVGIATPLPDNSAQLDVSSSSTGFLPPRLTTTQVNSIASPAAGLIIFNTTLKKPQYYDGTAWRNFDGT